MSSGDQCIYIMWNASTVVEHVSSNEGLHKAVSLEYETARKILMDIKDNFRAVNN